MDPPPLTTVTGEKFLLLNKSNHTSLKGIDVFVISLSKEIKSLKKE